MASLKFFSTKAAMFKLIVDGSFCHFNKTGGVGGYILDEKREYVAHFSHHVKSKAIVHQFEILAVIAGLNLAIKKEVKELEVCSDDEGVIDQATKMLKNKKINVKQNTPYKKELLEKLLVLSESFTKIKFTLHKCHHAHDLSRVYLHHKNLTDIIKQLQLIKTVSKKRTSDAAPALKEHELSDEQRSARIQFLQDKYEFELSNLQKKVRTVKVKNRSVSQVSYFKNNLVNVVTNASESNMSSA